MSEWTTYQLSELLAVLAEAPDEATVLRLTAERTAEALDAEVGAVIVERRVGAAVGFPEDMVPEAALLDVATGRATTLDIAGLGPCPAWAFPILGVQTGHLVVARAGEAALDPGELALLRATARAFALVQRMLRVADAERALRLRTEARADESDRLLAALEERQALLERLALIARSIGARTPLPQVLDAVTSGARDLLGQDLAALRLRDEADPDRLVLASAVAPRPAEGLLAEAPVTRVGEGSSGRAVAERRLVVVDAYERSDHAIPAYARGRVRLAMSVPILQGDQAIGSLTVASLSREDAYHRSEQEALLALAQHAALAIADARAAAAPALVSVAQAA